MISVVLPSLSRRPVGFFAFVSFLLLSLLTISCSSTAERENRNDQQPTRLNDDLEVYPLTDHIWVHVAMLDLSDGSRVPCNGMVYLTNGKAVIFDSPVNDSMANLLLDWIESDLHHQPIALVLNHFHEDCTGGMETFRKRGVEIWSNSMTCDESKKEGIPCADHLFTDQMRLFVGKDTVVMRYFGPGHSRDNIVCWIPKEKTLFGGCMVKSIGAGKGNLSDADTLQWSATVAAVKNAYPDVKYVVPGHGEAGGSDLLDYTMEMFDGRAR